MGSRFNYHWRLAATGLSFTLFGIGGVLIPLVGAPLLYLCIRDRRRRQAVARRLIHRTFLAFIYVMRGLGILRWRTQDLERLQRPGLLILANHPTLIDVVFLVAFVPDATCVVKGRLRGNPAMAGLISLAGYITNDKGDRMLNGASQALEEGSNLLIFPEGTRSRAGQPLRLQRGAARIAVRCRRDITPVIIQCRPATLSKEHKWYHIPARRFTMTFRAADDIAIAPFLDDPAPLAARRLTHHLERFFNKEQSLHDNNHTGERTQGTDHRVSRSGGHIRWGNR